MFLFLSTWTSLSVCPLSLKCQASVFTNFSNSAPLCLSLTSKANMLLLLFAEPSCAGKQIQWYTVARNIYQSRRVATCPGAETCYSIHLRSLRALQERLSASVRLARSSRCTISSAPGSKRPIGDGKTLILLPCAPERIWLFPCGGGFSWWRLG